LQQLGGRIQAAMTQVTQAPQAAETADKNRQAGEAYFLAHELKVAIQHLEGVSTPETEQDLRDDIGTYWRAAVALREDLAKAQRYMEEGKAKLQAKESELHTAEKQRTANIQQKVRDFREADKRPQPPAVPARAA
jgi:hypothetical protein